MRATIVERPIDAAALLAEVASPAHGATALFVGTVRDVNDGRAVTGIEYSAYAAMAEKEMRSILEEAAVRFGVTAAVVEHRVGALALGEASVVIATAHAHRGPALDANRYLIEQLKQRVPVWKRELYTDGTREWVDPSGARAMAGAPASAPGARPGGASHA
ncbi:MAG: molybdenum cofactor biosynthesis protein MoaE [Gemmatimonadetes bacterium]|nr:molybdenum cofactor biosynthesis protein MoaE [Gemmatimonadota bacterium]MBI3566801.1 molybdenum cofactor biosynthesis protein MoaE [Gemmatimonadota bacterium]